MTDRPPPPRPGFDDRVVTLVGGSQAFADLAGVLGSPTRAAVLVAVVRSKEPLHIQEVSRRVGVDASPVRTHLEVLARAGLVREVRDAHGRERRFTTDLSDARLILEDVNRPRPEATAAPAAPSKAAERARKKLEALARKKEKLDREAAKLRDIVRRG